jgi:hypothetical protein
LNNRCIKGAYEKLAELLDETRGYLWNQMDGVYGIRLN